MTAAIRWTGSRWRAQLLLYLSAYAVYSSARWIAAGDPARAIDHSHWIAHLERAVHVGIEQPVQDALDRGWPIWLLNHIYLGAQFLVVPAVLILLYWRARPIYRTLRNTLIATWLIAVPIYALFPVAPPRLAGLGIIDTISDQSEASLNSHVATSFYNPFAAVPSLHAGFAFAVGFAAAAAARRRPLKLLALLWGPLVSLSVVATGNHYLFDIVAGLLVTALGFAAGRAVERLSRRFLNQPAKESSNGRTGHHDPTHRRRLGRVPVERAGAGSLSRDRREVAGRGVHPPLPCDTRA